MKTALIKLPVICIKCDALPPKTTTTITTTQKKKPQKLLQLLLWVGKEGDARLAPKQLQLQQKENCSQTMENFNNKIKTAKQAAEPLHRQLPAK